MTTHQQREKIWNEVALAVKAGDAEGISKAADRIMAEIAGLEKERDTWQHRALFEQTLTEEIRADHAAFKATATQKINNLERALETVTRERDRYKIALEKICPGIDGDMFDPQTCGRIASAALSPTDKGAANEQ